MLLQMQGKCKLNAQLLLMMPNKWGSPNGQWENNMAQPGVPMNVQTWAANATRTCLVAQPRAPKQMKNENTGPPKM